MEEVLEEINQLKKEIAELKNTIRIMKNDHSFDMGRVFEEIDKINGEGE